MCWGPVLNSVRRGKGCSLPVFLTVFDIEMLQFYLLVQLMKYHQLEGHSLTLMRALCAI